MNVKQLTEITWILSDPRSTRPVGIVRKTDDGLKINNVDKTFKDFQEIANHLGYKNYNDSVSEEDVEPVSEIHGYPIRHDTAVEVTENDVNGVKIFSYKEKEGAKKVYAAGYFGLLFKNGYTGTFCPKLDTVQENKFIGPYKSKFDLQFFVNKENRKDS